MILIISSQFDQSTTTVIEWLIYKGVSFRRWNGEDTCVSFMVEIGANGELSIEMENHLSEKFNFEHFTKFWYRRGAFQIFRPKIKHQTTSVRHLLNQEWSKLNDFIFTFIRTKPHLGDIDKDIGHNKLMSLIQASLSGLLVPHSLITTEKEKMNMYTQSFKETITKAVDNVFLFNSKNRIYAVGTEDVSPAHIDALGARFFPTLIQEKINKSFELRVFFLKHDFYAMAIFSQNDEQTKVDFRNYNRKRPNRCVPYNLPDQIKNSLINYIDAMYLDTGSIDLILTRDGQYVFLEVNHLGQFGWLSDSCNYYIEEKIAHYLSKM